MPGAAAVASALLGGLRAQRGRWDEAISLFNDAIPDLDGSPRLRVRAQLELARALRHQANRRDAPRIRRLFQDALRGAEALGLREAAEIRRERQAG